MFCVEYEFDQCIEILVETQQKMTETRSENFTAIHRAWRKPRDGICRYKTFWIRIFERTTFLLLRCCSIHVKLCVLKTYSAGN